MRKGANLKSIFAEELSKEDRINTDMYSHEKTLLTLTPECSADVDPSTQNQKVFQNRISPVTDSSNTGTSDIIKQEE